MDGITTLDAADGELRHIIDQGAGVGIAGGLDHRAELQGRLVDRPGGAGAREGVVRGGAVRARRAVGDGAADLDAVAAGIRAGEGTGAVRHRECTHRHGSRGAGRRRGEGDALTLLETADGQRPALRARAVGEARGAAPRRRDGGCIHREGGGLVLARRRQRVVRITDRARRQGVGRRVLDGGTATHGDGTSILRPRQGIGDEAVCVALIGDGGARRPGIAAVGGALRRAGLGGGAVGDGPGEVHRALVDLPGLARGAGDFVVVIVQADRRRIEIAEIHRREVDADSGVGGGECPRRLRGAAARALRRRGFLDADRAAGGSECQRDGVARLDVAGGQVDSVARAVVGVLIGIRHTRGVSPSKGDGTLDDMEFTRQVIARELIVGGLLIAIVHTRRGR